MMSWSGYCKHGTYVGGCGIDWMCHPCEMGDPDPTPREMRRRLLSLQAELVELTLTLEAAFESRGLTPDAELLVKVTRGMRVQLDSARRVLTNALRWATSEDDDDWLRRQHKALEDEARAWDLART